MDVKVGMRVFVQTISGRSYAGVVKFVSEEWIDILDLRGRIVSIRFSEIKLIQEEK